MSGKEPRAAQADGEHGISGHEFGGHGPAGHDPSGRARVLGRGVLLGALLGAVALTAVAATGPEPEPAPLVAPRYVEVGAGEQIRHVYAGGFTFFVGGGVAVLDCDDDGLPDLYLAGGEQPASLLRNDSRPGTSVRFTPVPDPATDLVGVTGAYPLDIDGDGILDLVVLRVGENVVLRGLGDCRFERANEAWGIDGGDAWTTAFSATFEPGEQRPTLAFGNYLDPDDTDRATCQDNVLLRPEPGATTYAPPIALSPSWCTLSLLFSDWDRSGRRDLRVSNDRHYSREGEEQLWRIEPGDPPRLYTREQGWEHLRIWGMGIASHDVTGDGRPEVYLTSQGDNKLQTLVGEAGRPTYEDLAITAGVTAHRPHLGGDVRPSTAWHPAFGDVNNDGFIDLFVAKGNVEAQLDHAERDPSNLLLGTAEGRFEERSAQAGVVSYGRGRGAALVDLDLDGLLDLIEVQREEPVRIWRSLGAGSAEGRDATGSSEPMGTWLALRLADGPPNRDAIGAWVELRVDGRTRVIEQTVGGGHAGGHLGWIHVGLGTAGYAEVRVSWPDGETGPWQRVEASQLAVIERGADTPRLVEVTG